MAARKLYQALAGAVDAHHTCVAHNNAECAVKHKKALKKLTDGFLPSDSGVNGSTKLDVNKSTGEKLVLYTSFHHMNDSGMYNGWTEHVVTVRASLIHGVLLTISGRNRNQIKDYLYEVYDAALREEVAF